MAERGGGIIAQIAPANERTMISAREKGDKTQTGDGSALVAATIPPPFPPPSFYALFIPDVPLNATYGSPFRKVASRIFVGRAGRKPPRRRQWPPIPSSPPPPPSHVTDRSSFSFPPGRRRFGGLRERKDLVREGGREGGPSLPPGRVRRGARRSFRPQDLEANFREH